MRLVPFIPLVLTALLLLSSAAPTAADEAPHVKGGTEAIQDRINEAIDRGIMWLLRQQLADGSWGQDAERYPSGMTALALYTCLKSGVPLSHPSVELGFTNLLSIDPQETYALACHLLALGASGQPAHHPRMAVLTERLLGWEVRGGWSYPLAHQGSGWATRPGTLDLSNAQFAVLGLRAAHQAGIEIPRKVLRDIIRQTRFHQHIPREVGGKNDDGSTREAAGFSYHGPGDQGHGVATGSMTCAGITVLDLCRRMLGRKLSTKQGRQVEASIRHALNWLDTRWSVKENPGKEQGHKLYYLYGLERVGSLLGLETIGRHAWYAVGAEELLELQKDGGEWGNESQTSFALLFLLRATKGEVTGADRSRSAYPTYENDPNSSLRIRAEGHSPMTVWVTSVHPDVRALHGTSGQLAIEKVEYLVDGRVQLTAAQGPPPHGADPTHRAMLHFPHAGKFEVTARAHVTGPQGEVVLESTPLKVDVKLLVQPWAPYEAAWAARDLLLRGQVEVESSSHHHDHQNATKAVDVRTPGYWVCQPKPPDPRPTLIIKPARPVKANVIVLSPVLRRDDHRNQFDRPTQVQVTINGKGEPWTVPLAPDELRPVVLRLPKISRIKTLEVAIVERTPGRSWPGETGFREVALEVDNVARPSFAQDDLGTVTLGSETPDATIHYTLDGTLPTKDSPRYEGPFQWPGRTRLQAIAQLPSGETSRPLIATVRVPGEVEFR